MTLKPNNSCLRERNHRTGRITRCDLWNSSLGAVVPPPKVEIGTRRILLSEAAYGMNSQNIGTFAVHAAFKTGTGFDTIGAFAHLPAYKRVRNSHVQ